MSKSLSIDYLTTHNRDMSTIGTVIFAATYGHHLARKAWSDYHDALCIRAKVPRPPIRSANDRPNRADGWTGPGSIRRCRVGWCRGGSSQGTDILSGVFPGVPLARQAIMAWGFCYTVSIDRPAPGKSARRSCQHGRPGPDRPCGQTPPTGSAGEVRRRCSTKRAQSGIAQW